MRGIRSWFLTLWLETRQQKNSFVHFLCSCKENEPKDSQARDGRSALAKGEGFLQDLASVDSRGDFFDFIIGRASLDLVNAPYGGYRFPVEARLAGRVFIKFEVDVATGDPWMEPYEMVRLYDWLSFAGIPAPEIPVISVEQQFAEKLHAYTLPRQTPNSRVKDLVDMFALLKKCDINSSGLVAAVKATFERRKSHTFPPAFPNPPENWRVPFGKAAAECGFSVDLSSAFDEVRQYCGKLGIAQE